MQNRGLEILDSNWSSVPIAAAVLDQAENSNPALSDSGSSGVYVPTSPVYTPYNSSDGSQNNSTVIDTSFEDNTLRLEPDSNPTDSEQVGALEENPIVSTFSDIEYASSPEPPQPHRSVTISECSESALATDEGDNRISAPSLISDDAVPWYCFQFSYSFNFINFHFPLSMYFYQYYFKVLISCVLQYFNSIILASEWLNYIFLFHIVMILIFSVSAIKT